MLPIREDKVLVSSVEPPSENVFSVHILKNDTDTDQGMEVKMDMEKKVIMCHLKSDETRVDFVFSPAQAVSLGMWLAEAGHILNFAKTVNLTFTEEEEPNE